MKHNNISAKTKTINSAIGAFVCLVIIFAVNITDFAGKCNRIENDVLRLHIIANSDSEEDQTLKLKIRDVLLREGADIFDGSITKETAVDRLNGKLDYLTNVAQKVIDENGKNYTASVSIKNEYFNTREYENFTLPAGNYLSLCVRLGKAEGHNWWCVMFPPLCLPAAQNDCNEIYTSALSDDERELIENKEKYKVKFKIVELYNNIKNKISDK